MAGTSLVTGAQVLLLGMNDYSGLACARSLAGSGAHVDAVYLNRDVPRWNSRAVRVMEAAYPEFSLPSARVHVARLSKVGYDAILPLSDVALVLLGSLEGEGLAASPSVTFAESDRARNKIRLFELARSLDIPVPPTQVLTGIRQSDQPWPDVSLPAFVKPAYTAIEADDRIYSAAGRRYSSRHRLDQAAHDNLGHTPVLVQQPVPGFGLGVYVLALNGEVVSEVHQRRLRESPRGGGGTLRTTVPINSTASRHAERLIRALRWTGPAMVEFRWDEQNGTAWLMEVNCRFWGSLPLTVRAGLDYPVWEVYRLQRGKYPEIASEARPQVGVMQRNLRRDIIASLQKNSFASPGAWRAHLDTERVSDPGPTLEEGREVIHRVGTAVTRWIGKEWMRRRSIVAGPWPPTARVLFVCRGNIGRSPFAERWWRQHRGPNARSAGTLGRTGRAPSWAWRVAALKEGVSLDDHRAETLSLDLLKWSEIIVALDASVTWEVFSACRRAGIWPAIHQLNIADPAMLEPDELDSVVAALVDRLERLPTS